MRVADWIMKRLADEGLEHIFMLPGGGAMHLNDALACEPRLTPISCHHEQACGIAAEAYGRTGYSKNPGFGVALVTTGPGATNIVTPVTGAWIDSIPMLIISGQVKRADRVGARPLRQSGVQEVDIIPMVSGITKFAITLDDPSHVQIVFETAFHKMFDGRPGPVWIEIPLDVQGAQVNLDSFPPLPKQSSHTADPTSSCSDSVIKLLSTAQRPLILAGHGVRLSGASESFLKLVESWNVPVVTTWNALDLVPHNHDLYVGSPGVVALRAPNFALQNCDLLISIGCRLDNIITAYNPGNFAREAKKVVVDVDASELDKLSMDVDYKIHGDARQILDDWLAASSTFVCSWNSWLITCADWKLRYTVNDGNPFCQTGAISHYHFVDELSTAVPEGTIIATGSSGLAVEALYSSFRTKKGQRLFLTSGLGSMGYGLSSGIGACLGNGKKHTIIIESDGSLMLNLQELATLKGLNLPITVFIMDNQGYASIRNTQRNYFDSRFIATGEKSGLHMPNISAVAESFGIPCSEIHSSSELRNGLHDALQSPTPSMCIVHLKPDETLWPKCSAVPQSDGSIISMPLEDMTPLLPLDVLQNEMIIPLLESSILARKKN